MEQITLATTSTTTADILKGMAMILKYDPGAEMHGEHDVVYFGVYAESAPKMSDEELALMKEWKWREEDDYGVWYHFAST